MWYIASIISMPGWVASKLNTFVFSFFWSSKLDLLARDVVHHSTLKGGFGVVSVRYKVHALWLSGSVVMLLPRMRGPTR